MADKDKLRDMLDNIIKDNSAGAEVDFHDYAREKMQELLGRGKEAELEQVEDNGD